jgi:hypothetical protein
MKQRSIKKAIAFSTLYFLFFPALFCQQSDIVFEKTERDLLIKKLINYTNEILIPYKIKFFSFEFSALDFTNSIKNHYADKMESFDNQWRYTDSKNRTATYKNLYPVKYIFCVK